MKLSDCSTRRVHETNLFQVKKLKEKIGLRKKICTVVQKEIGTQTETKVQRTIQTQTLYNIQERNRNVSFQTSVRNCSRYSGDICPDYTAFPKLNATLK